MALSSINYCKDTYVYCGDSSIQRVPMCFANKRCNVCGDTIAELNRCKYTTSTIGAGCNRQAILRDFFHASCVQHDICYELLDKQSQCDSAFFLNMMTQCDNKGIGCKAAALLNYLGVVNSGQIHFQLAKVTADK